MTAVDLLDLDIGSPYLMHPALVFGIYCIRSSGLLIVSEVAVPQSLFLAILERIRRFRPREPAPG